MAIAKLLESALENQINNNNYFYISPTYKQSKMIAWKMLFEAFSNLPIDLQIKKNESELYVELWNLNKNAKSMIAIKGADDPDSLRGVMLGGCVLDEYARMKKNVFDEIIRPALTDLRGWCWFISTPQGFNHFYDLYNLAQREPDWAAFKFTTYDNPIIPKEEIDQAKKELNPDYFEQEFLAEFKRFTGLIYKDFDRQTHILDVIDITGMQLYRSIDFGTVHPFVCLWIAVDGDNNWYIYDEYYQSGQVIEHHAKIINNRSLKQNYIATYRDPSAKQLELELAQYNIYSIPAVNTVNSQDIEIGINKIQRQLKIQALTGKPKLFVLRHCENTIREFELYQWEEKKSDDKKTPNKPKKINDDAMDALRYFANTYLPVEKKSSMDLFLEDTNKEVKNKYTGY